MVSVKDIVVPAAGESVTEADVATWYKEDGDHVQMDEPLVELETDKASLDLTAEAAGILRIAIEEGTTVKVGQVIGTIDTAQAASTIEPVAPSTKKEGVASPAAAKQMAEKQIDPTTVVGSGKEGRITKKDVATMAPAFPNQPKKPVAPVVTPSSDTNQPIRRERMSRLRRTIASRLVHAQQTAALLTTFNEVDMSGIMAVRASYKEAFKETYGVGLGFMSFFTTAVCQSLAEFPVMNASVDGEDICYHTQSHIGIAVASPKGLVVPVIRQAETLTFQQIESQILAYAKQAKAGDLALSDMEGGTFTITNGGTFGSMLSTPIVNHPQSAILGMHNIIQRPVAVNGVVEIRPMMYVAVSYDHRIIDGSEAVRFLVAIKQRVEDPTRLLIRL